MSHSQLAITEEDTEFNLIKEKKLQLKIKNLYQKMKDNLISRNLFEEIEET